jgi:YbgC/YbaW family acyl-CoA thioester hydrolase
MARSHTCPIEVRGYELDGFGHLNHAVFLNYFEFARFKAFSAAGIPLQDIMARGEGIHVVRVEVDYLREVKLGDSLLIDTAIESTRRTSFLLAQALYLEGEEDRPHARARITAVWIGTDGKPTRVPGDVREAMGLA